MSKAKQVRHCRWKLERFGEYWHTGCGHDWSFIDGTTPQNNGVKFCHGCGKPVREIFNKRDLEDLA